MKIRMGVIGAGKISQVLHIPNILFSKYAELKCIADKDRRRVEEIKDRFGLKNVDYYDDYHELLKREDLDAVVVSVPNFLHSEVTVDALNNGKHVLVEKPMATKSSDAEKMIETMRRNHRILMVNHSQRFFPHHQKAREILNSGLLGEIRLVKTMFGHSGPENWSSSAGWFFKKDTANFGALGDLGVHKIDLIRYLTGLEITECVAITDTLEKNADVEDVASVILKLSNGAIATLDSNWITKGLEENYFVVYGEYGTMKIGQTTPSKIDIFLSKPVEFHGEITLAPLFTNKDSYWKMPVIDHFAKVCLGYEKPIVEPEDGYIAIKIIEKILESSSNKKFVNILD